MAQSTRDPAAADVARAREMIDTWVLIRPPALNVPRVMTAGDLRHLAGPLTPLPEHLRAVAFSRSVGDVLQISTPEESKAMDDAFFDSRRKALLDEADAILRTRLNEGGMDVGLGASARVALAYGRAQRLRWFTHIGRLPLPNSPWRAQLVPLWASIEGLLPADTLPFPPAEERWLDDAVRLAFTLGQARLNQGNVEKGIWHLLEAICWTASAPGIGRELPKARSQDALDALYLLLDHSPPSPSDGSFLPSFHWFEHASLLIKDIAIGRGRRVRAPMTAVPNPDGGLTPQFDDFYGSDEWWRGQNALPTGSAVLDLTLTDQILHSRLYRGEDTDYDRLDVNRLLQEGRGGQWLRAEGGVLEPTVGTLDAAVGWLGHYRVMRTSWGDARGDFVWRHEWSSEEVAKDEVWRLLYDIVFAATADRCTEHGIKHLAVSPDGALTAIPHHLLVAPNGERLGDKFAISYQPNLTGLLTLPDRDRLDLTDLKGVLVIDPSRTVGLAEWECDDAAASIGAPTARLLPDDATVAAINRACDGAGLLHFTGHAAFDWEDPDSAFLSVAGNARMSLADIERLMFAPGALVFLSACHTGRRGADADRTTSHGLVTSMFEAGAATVICTMWPVDSTAAALVSHWFYRRWLTSGDGRLASLRWATNWLRTASRADCEQVLGRRVYKRGERPLSDESYWGPFVLYGAW